MSKNKFLEEVPQQYSNDSFYELCRKFMDACLDSGKELTSDNKMKVYFSKQDIDLLAQSVKDYLKEYDVDPKELAKTINVYAYLTVDENDKRQKALYKDNYYSNGRPIYNSGTLFLFTSVPDEIMCVIIEKATRL